MNTRVLGLVGSFGLTMLVGCQVEIVNNGDDCGPRPDLGTCGGTLECVDGEWVGTDTIGCGCPATEPSQGQACATSELCSYPSDSDCGGLTTYECTDAGWQLAATDNCLPEPCPEYLPSDGSDCPTLGQICSYEEEFDCGEGSTVVTECTEEGWTSYWPRCLPEPVCPALAPEPGTECAEWPDAYYCQFSLSCSPDAFIDMHCDFGTTPPLWVVDYVQPCEQTSCGDLVDPDLCQATEGCEWLVPGCADESRAPIALGCYPTDDCQLTGCGPEEVCAPFIYDPCVDSGCNACGAERYVCVGAVLGGD